MRCYAERRPPNAAAQATGLSLNTVYVQYGRIRWRLILTRYYTDGAPSIDDPGLSPEIGHGFKQRRGLRAAEVYPHSAELIEWAEAWPPRLVLKHLRRIIALSGPLDRSPALSEPEAERLHAYVVYARTELIHDRLSASPDKDEAQRSFAARTKLALEAYWRAYRAVCKRLERAAR